jgi:hypothetical protein
MADEYASGHHDPHHHHKRAQLIYACAGVTVVITEQASFVVPPQRAVWVPAGVEHEAHMRGHVSLRTLYIDSTEFPNLPKTCQVIEVSALLRELIVEACRLPVEYDVEGRDGRVMNLLMTELLAMPTTPLDVPMPQDSRLVKVCTAILRDPAQHDPLDGWADMAGMGRRTFTRTFRRETGISFATWRQKRQAHGGAFAPRHRPARHDGRLRRRLQQPECVHRDVPPCFRQRADAVPRDVPRHKAA